MSPDFRPGPRCPPPPAPFRRALGTLPCSSAWRRWCGRPPRRGVEAAGGSGVALPQLLGGLWALLGDPQASGLSAGAAASGAPRAVPRRGGAAISSRPREVR